MSACPAVYQKCFTDLIDILSVSCEPIGGSLDCVECLEYREAELADICREVSRYRSQTRSRLAFICEKFLQRISCVSALGDLAHLDPLQILITR